jgi:hypothetical protein
VTLNCAALGQEIDAVLILTVSAILLDVRIAEFIPE